MATQLKINPQKTALVVIDLQNGSVSIPTEPYPSSQVVKNTSRILTEVRKNNMPAFLVHVTPSPDLKDALHPISETSFQMSGYSSS